METPLLRDPNIKPTKEVLEGVLGISYQAYEDLMKTVTGDKYGLVPTWNYYKDGKAWLCKVSYKKKTIFWLSVWDKFFKTGFYFTEKTKQGVLDLNIDEIIKNDFISRKSIGKFLPLAITLSNPEQIKDVLKVVEYKKSLK